MSAESAFCCPVCRASQSLSETCRRCQADLRLVVRARLRLAYVKRQRGEAIARGDIDSEATYARELRWLAPARG
jgi:hypothetical protein